MKIEVPQILIPSFIEPKDPIGVGLGVKGHFHVTKKHRGVIVQELDFDNIITDGGLKRFASETTNVNIAIGTYCILGTGTSTPVSTDVTLQAYGGATTKKTRTTTQSSLGSGEDRWLKTTIEYGLTDAIGTWTEVGITWSEASSNIPVFCRMLFKDEQGNPVSVEKTADDTLTIVYDFHMKRLSDAPTLNVINVEGTGDVTVSSLILDSALETHTSVTYRLNDPHYSRVRLGTGIGSMDPTRTACYTPINTNPTLCQAVPYVAGAFYREYVFEWAASVVGNITEAAYETGRSNNGVGVAPAVYMQFSPSINKTDTTKKIRLRPRITYGRI